MFRLMGSILFLLLLLLPNITFSQQTVFIDQWAPRSYIVSTAGSNFKHRLFAANPRAVCEKLTAVQNARAPRPPFVGTLVRKDSTGGYSWACEIREQGLSMISVYEDIQPWCHDATEYNYPEPLLGYNRKSFSSFPTTDVCSCGAVRTPHFADSALADPAKDQCQIIPSGPCTQWAKSSCFTKVNQLQTSMPPSGNARSVFHKTQLCIAGQSCLDSCRNDNCKWIGKTIVDFVDPYLQKTGLWSLIESGCNAASTVTPKILADRLCASNMALYHISADLDKALIENGCGSEDDWKRVYKRIQECSFATEFTAAEQEFVKDTVLLLREISRRSCVSTRQARGLDVEATPTLKGKLCTP